jgi:hypothetical protein
VSKYSSKDLELTAGATPMKAHILDDVTIGVEIGLEESTAFGDTWAAFLSTGVQRAAPFTVGGLYDDTATTGPDAKFNTLGTTIAIVTTWGGSKTSAFNAIVQKYVRLAKMGAMTRYVATLQPTGAVTEE